MKLVQRVWDVNGAPPDSESEYFEHVPASLAKVVVGQLAGRAAEGVSGKGDIDRWWLITQPILSLDPGTPQDHLTEEYLAANALLAIREMKAVPEFVNALLEFQNVASVFQSVFEPVTLRSRTGSIPPWLGTVLWKWVSADQGEAAQWLRDTGQAGSYVGKLAAHPLYRRPYGVVRGMIRDEITVLSTRKREQGLTDEEQECLAALRKADHAMKPATLLRLLEHQLADEVSVS